ncbi:MAG TPA: multiheme c-type cytochrome [Saprospiraceae bacterium]|nr:multiheme c-type cytochrome [Saprospiraceae bacterium]
MNRKYYIPIVSIFILVLSLVYIELFMDDIKVIVPLKNSWEMAVPHQEVPQGLTSIKARDCGMCHVQHYEEWQKSTHANAWTDKQFQAELKKESSPFMCINCHIPLQNQQEYIIKGLEDGDIYKPIKEINPHFDAELQMEGITCVSCHLRDNKIIGPTGTTLAPHAVKKDTEHLSERLCISCHNATAVVTPTLACSFQTGDEWKAGPFYKQKNCISCHMPETHRSIVAGMSERKSRFHSFPASGIPKSPTHHPERLESLTFTLSPNKKTYATKDSLIFTLELTNANAGHRVPTGNPERFIVTDIVLKDKKGNIISQKQERIGEHWEWHPVVKKISDNNLNPGESRKYTFKEEPLAKGSYTIHFSVSKHRLTPESAKYNKLGADYPLSFVAWEQTYDFDVK